MALLWKLFLGFKKATQWLWALAHLAVGAADAAAAHALVTAKAGSDRAAGADREHAKP